jgi:hypothetical protein
VNAVSTVTREYWDTGITYTVPEDITRHQSDDTHGTVLHIIYSQFAYFTFTIYFIHTYLQSKNDTDYKKLR